MKDQLKRVTRGGEAAFPKDEFDLRIKALKKLLAANDMGEPLMATPALAGGVMYVRGARHLFAVAGD